MVQTPPPCAEPGSPVKRRKPRPTSISTKCSAFSSEQPSLSMTASRRRVRPRTHPASAGPDTLCANPAASAAKSMCSRSKVASLLAESARGCIDRTEPDSIPGPYGGAWPGQEMTSFRGGAVLGRSRTCEHRIDTRALATPCCTVADPITAQWLGVKLIFGTGHSTRSPQHVMRTKAEALAKLVCYCV